MSRKYQGGKKKPHPTKLLTNKRAILRVAPFGALWTQASIHARKVVYWANVINRASVCRSRGLAFPCFLFWEISSKEGIWFPHCQLSRWTVNIWNCSVFFFPPTLFAGTETLLWALLFILEASSLFLKAAMVLGRLEEIKIEGSVAYWIPGRTTLSPNLLLAQLRVSSCSELEEKQGKYYVCAGEDFCWLLWKAVREAGPPFPCGKTKWSRNGAWGAGLVFSVSPILCNSYSRGKAINPLPLYFAPNPPGQQQ